jgi:hypothetical protein
MKNPAGKPIQSPAKLLNKWRNSFEGLFNVEQTVETHEIDPAESDLNINTGSISLDEVQKAVERLKNDKRINRQDVKH